MATNRLQLEQQLSEVIGDYLEFDTSTNIGAASTVVVATALQAYDGGKDDYFQDSWLSFQEGANLSAGYRQISDYAQATGTLTIRGAAMTVESAAVTLRVHKFNPNNKWIAISRAVEQLYPTLYKPIDNMTLVTGNILPNAHFEDWASTAVPDFYEVTNAAASAIVAAGSVRGATKSVRVIPSASAGYLYIRAQSFEALRDLSGKTVSFYAWAYPEATDDPALVIYTKNIAGSTQTLASTTTAASAQWNLLKLEDQVLNDNLVDCQFRFRVATSTKYAYFDDAIACGMQRNEYVLPGELQDGVVSNVRIQTHGYSSNTIPKMCYEMMPRYWGAEESHGIIQEGDYLASSGTYKRLYLYDFPTNYRRMRIKGFAPIPPPAADTATIYLDGEKLNLVTAKAAEILYRLEQGPVSSEDKGRYYTQIQMWQDEYKKLVPHLGMIRPPGMLNTGE